MGGFEVDPEALQTQASLIESGITARLQECLTAAERADEDENLQYGVILSPLAWPAMEIVAGQAQDGIRAALQLSETLTQALNGIAECYTGVDDQVCTALERIAEEVGE
ncbi:hypothetical protein [Glycomyces arizonensis]|uniref:hypothetical protein n=1 Tax=Glycomyces arizonensis TaxID=256035 RepID=UPI0004164E25|nr:hypothetical protein [Glycomyces arizonensis]